MSKWMVIKYSFDPNIIFNFFIDSKLKNTLEA